MIWGIYRNKVTAIIATFILLIFSYILLCFYAEKLGNQSQWVNHTYAVIGNLETLSSENKEIEYSYNGFVTSDHLTYQMNFKQAKKRIDSVLNNLEILVSDNSQQIERLQVLKALYNQKINRLEGGMMRAESYGENIEQRFQDSLIKSIFHGAYVGKVRSQISLMQSVERGLLKMRTDKIKSFSNLIKLINFISLLIALSFALAGFFIYRKEYFIRKKVSGESELYKIQLEKRVEELNLANKEINDLKNIEKFASTGRIARTIAHEVRNPLTNINLATDQLKDVKNDEEGEKEMLLGMIVRNSLRINQLISNLLNATKFTELESGEESVNEIVDEALELAKDRIELTKIKINKNYSTNICKIKVDKEKIKIAFLNIIVNAIEAIEGNDTGTIYIETYQKNDKCHVIIKDNGLGMDEETLSKLFEPYFTAKENGNGLGLTNTQNIILSHKGKINIDSKPGEGSTFEVILDI